MGSQQVKLEQEHEKLQHNLEDILMELHRKSEFSEFHKLLLRDFTLQHRSYYLSIPLGFIEEHEHELSEELGSSNGIGIGIGIGIGMNGGNGNGSNSAACGNPGNQNGFFQIYSSKKSSTSRTKWDWSPSLTARHKKTSKQDAPSLTSSSSSGMGLNIRLNMDLRFLLTLLFIAGSSDNPYDSLFGSGSLALSAIPGDSHRLGLHCKSSKEFFHSLLSYIHRRLSAMNLTNDILTRTEEDDQSWMFPRFHVLSVGY